MFNTVVFFSCSAANQRSRDDVQSLGEWLLGAQAEPVGLLQVPPLSQSLPVVPIDQSDLDLLSNKGTLSLNSSSSSSSSSSLDLASLDSVRTIPSRMTFVSAVPAGIAVVIPPQLVHQEEESLILDCCLDGLVCFLSWHCKYPIKAGFVYLVGIGLILFYALGKN